MKFNKLYNAYNKYYDYLCEHTMSQTPSVVDFGTAMANKRRNKRNRRNKL